MAAQIKRDIFDVGTYGLGKAPVSIKRIKGHPPMFEIRTGGYRTLAVFHKGDLFVLDVAKKRDQKRAISVAAKRMKAIIGK